MKSFSSLARLALLGLVALIPCAQAQLSLTGSTRGEFTGSNSFFTLIDNGTVTSTLYTGIPFPFLPPTSISFTRDTFSDVGDGDTFGLGTVKIKNGVTFNGTAATFAVMDLYLNLSSHGVTNHKLTTLYFAMEHTPNYGFVPDLFFIGYDAPAALKVADTLVAFDIDLTNPDFAIEPGELIGEKKTGTVGLLAEVQFTPVPEPSTYAAFAAAGLIGFVAWRRRQVRAAVAA